MYVGEFKDGQMNGQGTYTFADGDKYVGEWKDGKYHGQGIFTNADGTKGHVGEWENGAKSLRPSIQAQVVLKMRDAVCESKNHNAALPFFLESDHETLRLSLQLNELGEKLMVDLGDKTSAADAFAKTCHEGIRIVDTIKVSDVRYIVKFYEKAEYKSKEIVVVFNAGEWKLSLP